MPKQIIVTEVQPEGHAHFLGVASQDIIVSIGSRFIESLADISKALSDSPLPSEMVVLRGMEQIYFTITERKLSISFNEIEASHGIIEEIELIREYLTLRNKNHERIQNFRRIIVTTTDTLPNMQISEVVAVVTGESAFYIEASLVDFLVQTTGGAAAKSYSSINKAIDNLKKNAALVGADAVIGLRIDTSAANKNIKAGVFVTIAVGTAVKLCE